MEKTFCTRNVAARDRFAYWRDAICDAYVHLGCETPRRTDFAGSISLRRISAVGLSFVDGDPQHVRRRRQDIARSTEEFFLLSIQRKGIGRVIQHTREAVLNPGDSALYSSTDPYELVFGEPFGQLVVQVPKQAVLDRLPIAEMLTAVPITSNGGTGKLVADCLIGIAGSGGEIDALSRPHLSSTVTDLLCSGLASVSGQAICDLNRQDLLTTLRIEAFIAANLKDPDLSRTDVARGMNMSVRRINDLLAKKGTSITRRIQEVRLERIHRELSDPAFQGMRIGTIALKWGFTNLQHFSRSFRRKYGLSPRDIRASLRR